MQQEGDPALAGQVGKKGKAAPTCAKAPVLRSSSTAEGGSADRHSCELKGNAKAFSRRAAEVAEKISK